MEDTGKCFFCLQVTDSLVQEVKGSDISIISQEIFDQDPLTRVQNLKVNCFNPNSLSNTCM